MNKFLSNVAAGVMSTALIVIGTKVIYNELPEGAKNKLICLSPTLILSSEDVQSSR